MTASRRCELGTPFVTAAAAGGRHWSTERGDCESGQCSAGGAYPAKVHRLARYKAFFTSALDESVPETQQNRESYTDLNAILPNEHMYDCRFRLLSGLG